MPLTERYLTSPNLSSPFRDTTTSLFDIMRYSIYPSFCNFTLPLCFKIENEALHYDNYHLTVHAQNKRKWEKGPRTCVIFQTWQTVHNHVDYAFALMILIL